MSARRAILLSLTALALSSVAACGGTELQPEMPDPTAVDRSADEMGLPEASSGDDGDGEGDEQSATPPPVQVIEASRSELEGSAPQVRITSPRANQLVRGDTVSVQLRVSNWELEPAGRHIHVIVDNEPYIAVRDVSTPIDLTALVRDNLGHELAEGTHVLRVFPSRGHHESVKTPGAFQSRVFHFRSRTADFTFDETAPLLTYSRPKGCNVAGDRILLDFYVSNVELGDQARVHYDIDHAIEGDITSWTPHWIENLPSQRHTLRLSLRNAAGEAIAGPFNDTEREFEVTSRCE